ncbi:MAG: ABC transporter substrate-binding protein [Fimbriimonas sp.]|nr:ABC transporter substrate-binding protein [Fimbriimonas sp.]
MDQPKSVWIGRVFVAALIVFVAVFWTSQLRAQYTHHARKHVRFWHMWTAEWKDVVDKIVDRFNKSQDEYEVEALSVPSSGDSKFILGVLGGDPPDVMAQWSPIIPPWADANLLRPLDELMSPEEKRLFDTEAYPVVKKLGTYKGRLYGLTTGINMWAIYYLPDQLRKAGIDPDHLPNTLEGLFEVSQKLNRFDKQGNLVHLGWAPDNIQMFTPIFGGSMYDRAHSRLTIDKPENLRALTFLVEARKRLGFENVVKYTSGLDMNSASGGWPFIGGAYTFTVDGQWRVEQLRKYAPELEYRTIAVPAPVGGRSAAGWSNGNFMIVPRGAKEAKGAWEFIKFWSGLTNPNRAAEFYTWGGWLPLTPEITRSPIYQAYLRKYPQFKTFVDLMPSENMEVLPPVPFQQYLSDQIGKMEDSAVRGTLTPKKAIEGLQTAVDQEVSRRKELGYAQ